MKLLLVVSTIVASFKDELISPEIPHALLRKKPNRNDVQLQPVLHIPSLDAQSLDAQSLDAQSLDAQSLDSQSLHTIHNGRRRLDTIIWDFLNIIASSKTSLTWTKKSPMVGFSCASIWLPIPFSKFAFQISFFIQSILCWWGDYWMAGINSISHGLDRTFAVINLGAVFIYTWYVAGTSGTWWMFLFPVVLALLPLVFAFFGKRQIAAAGNLAYCEKVGADEKTTCSDEKKAERQDAMIKYTYLWSLWHLSGGIFVAILHIIINWVNWQEIWTWPFGPEAEFEWF